MAEVGRTRNPMFPLHTAAKVVLGGSLALLLTGLLLAMFVPGASFLGIGANAAVCVDAPAGLAPVPDSGTFHGGLRAGVNLLPNSVNLCVDQPGTSQKLLSDLTTVPNGLLWVGLAYLVIRLARTAAQDGTFTLRAARQLKRLAWALLIGEFATGGIQAAATLNLLDSMIADRPPLTAITELWPFPWLALFVSLGLLTFARTIRLGVTMREEIEATI